MNYYNEFDPFAAAWLRELTKAGQLPAGYVDERSILEVKPGDLAGYSQCHFFAGIGGWPLALRLAEWPNSRPVWTGSCPCQPFSSAGRRRGFSDERHLWPVLFDLIRECRPDTFFGEQISAKDGLAWFDLVSTDLEGAGYAVGQIDSCAAGVGAPHIRQRLYFVADADYTRPQGRSVQSESGSSELVAGASSSFSPMGNSSSERRQQVGRSTSSDESSDGRKSNGGDLVASPDFTNGFWANPAWVYCRDNKRRPIEPGTFPLAYGVPARVGRLRGYGNALAIPQAQAFVESFMEVTK